MGALKGPSISTAKDEINADRELIDAIRRRLSARAAAAAGSDLWSLVQAAQTLMSAGSIVDEREIRQDEGVQRARLALQMGGIAAANNAASPRRKGRR